MDSIRTALSGIRAGQQALDSTAANLANITTNGYQARQTDLSTGAGGQGVVASTRLQQTEGGLRATGQPLDVAVQGTTFMAVEGANGEQLYTRGGSLTIDSEGYLATTGGNRLAGNIQVPAAATGLSISADGMVSAEVNGESVGLGQIQATEFSNPGALQPAGNGLLTAPPEAGAAITGNFGDTGFGVLSSGAVPTSNVDLATEMTDLLMTQRFIQFQTGVIQRSDEIMQETVNLVDSQAPPI